MNTENIKEEKIKTGIKIASVLTTVLIAIPLVFIFVIFWIASYGFNTKPCLYTEKILPTPNNLSGTKVIFENDSYIMVNYKKDFSLCSPIMNSAEWIVSKSSGFAGEKIPIGTQLDLKYIIAQTKHGIRTIDSGEGPWFYFILSDEKGSLYFLSDDDLGKYGEIAIYNDNQKINPPQEFQLEALYNK